MDEKRGEPEALKQQGELKRAHAEGLQPAAAWIYTPAPPFFLCRLLMAEADLRLEERVGRILLADGGRR